MFIKFNTVLIVFARVRCSKHSFSKVTQVVCIQGSRYNLKKRHCSIVHDYDVMIVLVTGVTVYMNRE